jgi:hypothetical protein
LASERPVGHCRDALGLDMPPIRARRRRIDSANTGSVQRSGDKAMTAASFRFATHELAQGMAASGP